MSKPSRLILLFCIHCHPSASTEAARPPARVVRAFRDADLAFLRHPEVAFSAADVPDAPDAGMCADGPAGPSVISEPCEAMLTLVDAAEGLESSRFVVGARSASDGARAGTGSFSFILECICRIQHLPLLALLSLSQAA